MNGDRLRTAGGLAALALVAIAVGASWLGGSAVSAGSATGAAADAGGTGHAVAAADQDPVVAAGRQLFVANCASCHGPQGEGGAAGPSLIGVGAASADFYLRTGRMPLSAPNQRVVPQEPHFADPEIQALVAYVASLGDGPAIPQVSSGGDLHRGWQLFQANCAACHNATGSGNAIGGGFVAVGLGNADPTTIAEATIIGPGAMPAFRFDDRELADLAAYIEYLATAPAPGGAAIGQTGPVAEGFIGVAIGLPALILVSLFVARHARRGGARPTDEDSVDQSGVVRPEPGVDA
ncbi:MAG TPA: c-type cytochrome [Candidatus Limnocylindrales bacterium]|nr:c-type cytochrome [Candidatus Limnocylindrales bacterium]